MTLKVETLQKRMKHFNPTTMPEFFPSCAPNICTHKRDEIHGWS